MKKLSACVAISMFVTFSFAQGPLSAPQLTVKAAKGYPFLSERNGRRFQSIDLTVENAGDSAPVTIRVAGAPPLTVVVGKGTREIEAFAPETTKPGEARFRVEAGQQTIYSGMVS